MIADRIEIDSKIMIGKPVIRGTRITVELILRKLSEGATQSDLIGCISSADTRGHLGSHPLRG